TNKHNERTSMRAMSRLLMERYSELILVSQPENSQESQEAMLQSFHICFLIVAADIMELNSLAMDAIPIPPHSTPSSYSKTSNTRSARRSIRRRAGSSDR